MSAQTYAIILAEKGSVVRGAMNKKPPVPKKILTQENIDAVWPTIISEVRVFDKTLQALLNNGCSPLVIADTLCIIVKTDFLEKQLKKPVLREMIEKVVSNHIAFTPPCVPLQEPEVHDFIIQAVNQFAEAHPTIPTHPQEQELSEELSVKKDIIKDKKRHIAVLRRQIDKLGEAYAPANMFILIDDYEEDIRKAETAILGIKQELREPLLKIINQGDYLSDIVRFSTEKKKISIVAISKEKVSLEATITVAIENHLKIEHANSGLSHALGERVTLRLQKETLESCVNMLQDIVHNIEKLERDGMIRKAIENLTKMPFTEQPIKTFQTLYNKRVVDITNLEKELQELEEAVITIGDTVVPFHERSLEIDDL